VSGVGVIFARAARIRHTGDKEGSDMADNKALAQQISERCDSIKVFTDIFSAADEVSPKTVDKLERAGHNIDLALAVFAEDDHL
jgi:hypothetical protein